MPTGPRNALNRVECPRIILRSTTQVQLYRFAKQDSIKIGVGNQARIEHVGVDADNREVAIRAYGSSTKDVSGVEEEGI